MRAETLLDRLVRATTPQVFAAAFVALRVAVGLQFLLSGMAKLGDWSAATYLNAATGPFAEWFQSLAGSPVVDQLNVWGQIGIGLALLLGLLTRPAGIAGAAMMVLYYFAQFTQNTSHGFIDEHVLLALVFALFAAGGAGHVVGLNGLALRNLRQPGRAAHFFFG